MGTSLNFIGRWIGDFDMSSNRNSQTSLANKEYYDKDLEKDYVDGTPHIKHPQLHQFYITTVSKVFEYANRFTTIPRVLDLGAGEGSATLPFLELGARVTAVDISENQLEELRNKCQQQYGDRLIVKCQDIYDSLSNSQDQYDIIVASSFLHHIPDYLGLIQKSLPLLTPHGQFFSFQDPIRYDSAGRFTMIFTNLAYFSWRVFRGDVLGGIQRRIRRSRGVYLADSPYDNAEYHVTRNGVDQDAICALFRENKFDYELLRYFSTQSSFFQPIGDYLKIKNTFGVIARKQ
jgi:2-polyprenyl-3-methyl-5-hydroxy-6-metoxy-1,4-benzoquinol methylase